MHRDILKNMLPDGAYKYEPKDEPFKKGWQQPIVSWSPKNLGRLKLNYDDNFVDAVVKPRHLPFRE